MILESAQLLCTAHRILDGHQKQVSITSTNGKARIYKKYLLDDLRKEKLFYSSTHVNHPCAIWCRANINNYMWLHELFVQLCAEYTYRYGKQHKSYLLLAKPLEVSPLNISKNSFTQPAQAMPEKYRSSDSVAAYRSYYMHEKRRFAKWTKRKVPDWFI